MRGASRPERGNTSADAASRALLFEFHRSEPGGLLRTEDDAKLSRLGPAERNETLTRFIDIVVRRRAGRLTAGAIGGRHWSTECQLPRFLVAATTQLNVHFVTGVAQQHRTVVTSGTAIIWLHSCWCRGSWMTGITAGH